MRTVALGLVLLALGCERRGDAAGRPGRVDDPVRALYAGTSGTMVLDPSPNVGETDALRAALLRAAEAAPELDTRTAVIVQNDVWGLWKRLRRNGASPEVVAAAERLMAALARDPSELAAIQSQPHTANLEGDWTEVGTEHAVLQHEAAHGMRRVARLYRSGEQHRALGTHLVAIGRDGQPHVTSIPGELEVLHFASSGPPVAAEVFDLDRTRFELVRVSTVEHLPAAGADAFFATFDPPAKVEDIPCVECHHDAFMMSLPDPDDPVESRLAEVALLAERPGVD